MPLALEHKPSCKTDDHSDLLIGLKSIKQLFSLSVTHFDIARLPLN